MSRVKGERGGCFLFFLRGRGTPKLPDLEEESLTFLSKIPKSEEFNPFSCFFRGWELHVFQHSIFVRCSVLFAYPLCVFNTFSCVSRFE